MNAQQLIAAIDNIVVSFAPSLHSTWTIGVTDDPERGRREHGNPKFWMTWRVDTEEAARYVEGYFLNKGMKEGAGGGDAPTTTVYIF